MGETFDDEDPVVVWHAMVEFAEQDEALRDLAARMRAAGPPPSGTSALYNSPLILDTAVGGDPDDAIALVVAALRVPHLALVVTSDELGGERARLARHLLDLTGRPDVPVVAGTDLANVGYYRVEDLIPPHVPPQDEEVLAAVEVVCQATGGPVRWAGLAPMSNLAAILAARPDLAARLTVTQATGPIDDPRQDQVDHSPIQDSLLHHSLLHHGGLLLDGVRLDPDAAAEALGLAIDPYLVVADVARTPAMELTAESPLYKRFATPDAPAWAALLRTCLDRWFASTWSGSIQHGSLTLAAALLHPSIDFIRDQVAVDPTGRMSRDPNGVRVRLAVEADPGGFMWWLEKQLAWSR